MLQYRTEQSDMVIYKNGEFLFKKHIPFLQEFPKSYIDDFFEHAKQFDNVDNNLGYLFLIHWKYNPPVKTNINGMICCHLDPNNEMIIYVSSMLEPITKSFRDFHGKDVTVRIQLDKESFEFQGKADIQYLFIRNDDYTIQMFKVGEDDILKLLTENIGKNITIEI